MIAAFVFIFLLAAAGATIFFVLSDFEKLSDEGITFEVVPGYVAVDGISMPVVRNRNFSHYMFIGLVSQKFRLLDSNNPHQGDGIWRKDTEQNFARKRFGWH